MPDRLNKLVGARRVLCHFSARPAVLAQGGFLMNNDSVTTHSWSTSSFGGSVDTSPMELSALGEHLNVCRSTSGRLFALRCAAEKMNGFVAGRFVTTLAVAVTVLIGVGLLGL